MRRSSPAVEPAGGKCGHLGNRGDAGGGGERDGGDFKPVPCLKAAWTNFPSNHCLPFVLLAWHFPPHPLSGVVWTLHLALGVVHFNVILIGECSLLFVVITRDTLVLPSQFCALHKQFWKIKCKKHDKAIWCCRGKWTFKEKITISSRVLGLWVVWRLTHHTQRAGGWVLGAGGGETKNNSFNCFLFTLVSQLTCSVLICLIILGWRCTWCI